jgi:hypothetical protein
MNRPIDNLFAQGARMVNEEAIELTLASRRHRRRDSRRSRTDH